MYASTIPQSLSKRAAAPLFLLLSWIADDLVYKGGWEFLYTGDKETERAIGRAEGLIGAFVAICALGVLFIASWSADYITGIAGLAPILISGLWGLSAFAHIENIRIEEVG